MIRSKELMPLHKKLRPKALEKDWKFSLKLKYWKLVLRSIQASIFVLSASLSIPEGVPININHKSSKNWGTELKTFHGNSKIVFYILRVFMTFHWLILIPDMISKLTDTFNCIFVPYIWICHARILGLQVSGIRAFA